MAAACLRRYQVISIDGDHLILHSRVGDEWQLKNPKDGRITTIPVASLRKKYEEGKLEFMIKDRLSGSTPILRTLSLRPILGKRSVHVQAQALQP